MKQHSPPHPGKILKEFYLRPLNVSVSLLAKRINISRPRMSDIINGRSGISITMALKLAKAFNTTPHYWCNLQIDYDLWKAENKTKANI